MIRPNIDSEIQKLLNKSIRNKEIHGIQLSVSNGTLDLHYAIPDFNIDDCFFIASTTKLYVSALIHQAVQQNLIHYESQLADFFSRDLLDGLLRFGSVDYAPRISIKQLLSHTSGLADYFEDRQQEDQSYLTRLLSGEDFSWSFPEVIMRTKQLQPKFIPGTPNKAHYSDTNYQLLGQILESIYSKPFEQLVREKITVPLGLTKTYIYTDASDTRPRKMYFGNRMLHIPNAMTSFGPDGGGVSNSDDLMVFIKAFFNGYFFPTHNVPQLMQWNRIMFPLKSGTGLMCFSLPRIFSPFRKFPMLIGHSGLSGAFAFYAPAQSLFLTGTVNQIKDSSQSFRLMIRVQDIIRKNRRS